MSPQDGFNRLLRDAYTQVEVMEELMNLETREKLLDNYDLTNEEKKDLMESTATKLSDLYIDFNPIKRYGKEK